jgi:hypothetical protein
MTAHGIRLILGLIAATVIAADEQGFHLHGMNKAGQPRLRRSDGKTGPGRPPALVYGGSDSLSPHGL